MRFLLLFSFCLLISCSENPSATDQATPDFSTELLGTWEIVELRVNAPTYLGEDTTMVQHIKEADWAKIYGVKPARTNFTNDGKLKRSHYFKNGQLTDVVNGLWRMRNDSLFVIEPNVTFTYLPTLEGEQLKLKGLIDYDRDGEVDDDYEANYRLVSRTQ